jgi:hypothetical protein
MLPPHNPANIAMAVDSCRTGWSSKSHEHEPQPDLGRKRKSGSGKEEMPDIRSADGTGRDDIEGFLHPISIHAVESESN